MIRTPNQEFLCFSFGWGMNRWARWGGWGHQSNNSKVTQCFTLIQIAINSSRYIKRTSSLNQKNCVRGAEGKLVKLWILVG